MKRAVLLCLVIGCRPSPPDGDRSALLRDLHREAALQTQDLERVLTLVYDRIDEHFRIRLARVDDVGGHLFSAKGKWRAVFWSDANYERSVKRLLDRRLFDGIPELMETISRDLEAAAEASDNRLMAAVEGKLAVRMPALDIGQLRKDYVEGLAASVFRDTEINALSLAVGDVAAAVVTSALAAGAATSWWTAGAGMVAAVIAAIVVESLWGDEFESSARGVIGCKLLEFRIETMRKIGDAAEAAVIRYLGLREEAIIHAVELHPA